MSYRLTDTITVDPGTDTLIARGINFAARDTPYQSRQEDLYRTVAGTLYLLIAQNTPHDLNGGQPGAIVSGLFTRANGPISVPDAANWLTRHSHSQSLLFS